MCRRREVQTAGVWINVHVHHLPIRYFALKQEPTQRGFDLLLDGPFQGPRAEMRIVSGTYQSYPRGVGCFQPDMALGESPSQPLQLDLHDLLQVLLAES